MRKLLALSAILILLSAPISHAANPKANSSCPKLSAKQAYSGKIFTCLAKGKLRVWDKGSPIQKENNSHPTPTPAATPTLTPTPAATPTLTPAPTPVATSVTALLDAGIFGIVRTISNNGGNPQPMECKTSDGNQGFRSQKTFFVDPKNPKLLGIGIEFKGFYLSSDAGATWKISSSGLIGYPIASDSTKPCHTEFSELVIDSQDSNHLVVSRAGEPGTIKDYFSENAGLYESKDGGKNWRQILTQDGIGVYVHDGLAISHQNSQIMYAGTTTNGRRLDGGNTVYVTKGVIYKTINGGLTWSELPTGAPADIGIGTIAIDPTDDKIVTVSTLGRQKLSTGTTFGPGLGIIKTVDGGATWKRIDSLNSGFASIEFSENNPLNALGSTFDGNVLSSSDGGATWVKLNGLFAIRAITYDLLDKTGASGLIADGFGTIIKFGTNGEVMIPAGSLPSLTGHETRVTRLAISSDGTWYAAGHYTDGKSHQVGFVFKSSDSGQSWVKILDTDNLK